MSVSYRILFVCHGNICRSTMAQSVMQHLVDQAGASDAFLIDSAATTVEELGNPPHPGTVRQLGLKGVPVVSHRARKVACNEFGQWDLIVYMDAENERHLARIFRDRPQEELQSKLVRLMTFAPGAGIVDTTGAVLVSKRDYAALGNASLQADSVADPWYTGNFDDTYRDVLAGCSGLLAWLMDGNEPV